MFPRGDSKRETEREATLSFTKSDPEMGGRTSTTSSCDNEHEAVQRNWVIINSLITGEKINFLSCCLQHGCSSSRGRVHPSSFNYEKLNSTSPHLPLSSLMLFSCNFHLPGQKHINLVFWNRYCCFHFNSVYCTNSTQVTDTEHVTFTEAENPNKVELQTEIFEVAKNEDKSQDPKQQDVFVNNLQTSVWRKVSDETRDAY